MSKPSLKSSQDGMVSIVLTTFVLLVLSLIVLAFSQIARREQQQTLDRQLSTEAYVAAESGINETVAKNREGDASVADLSRDDCDGSQVKIGDPTKETYYSCVLYDRAPPTIQYSSVNQVRGELVSLQTESSELRSLTFTWKAAGMSENSTNFTECGDLGDFPPQSTPRRCDAGLLRVMLMPVQAGAVSREKLAADSRTIFIQPIANGSGVGTLPGNKNTDPMLVAADCEVPPPAGTGLCTATISGLGVTPGVTMYMRINSIYRDSSIDIAGDDGSVTDVRFTQAQIKVDVTGKSADVLRRLQVRVPMYEQHVLPQDVVTAMNGICKRVATYPAVGGSPGLANNDDCGGLE